MGILISGLSALGTFYAEANPALVGTDVYKDENKRNKQIFRLLGKVPTIAACAYRHRIGRPYNTPVNVSLFQNVPSIWFKSESYIDLFQIFSHFTTIQS